MRKLSSGRLYSRVSLIGYLLTLARQTTRPEARAKLQALAHWQMNLFFGSHATAKPLAHNGWAKQTISS